MAYVDLDRVDCTNLEELREAVAGEVWFHSIDLGNGIVAKGQKSSALLAAELAALQLPDLAGKTVLDIGAYDGFYSFEAERRGAKRVVALDLQVWEVETSFSDAFHRHCASSGAVPDPPYRTEWLKWDRQPERMPGKKKFDLARRALSSAVEPVVRDFMATGPEDVGVFDVTLFLGVLYHLEDPLRGMRRVASLTREVAILESEAIYVPGFEDHALCEFFPTDELNGDPSNWWAPNERALLGFCKAAGFSRVEVKQSAPRRHHKGADRDLVRYRAMLHAWK